MEKNIDLSVEAVAALSSEYTGIAVYYGSMAESLNTILENVKKIKKYAGRAENGFDSYYKSDSELRSKMRSDLSDINDDISNVITEIYKVANEATRRQNVYKQVIKTLTDAIDQCYTNGNDRIKGTLSFP